MLQMYGDPDSILQMCTIGGTMGGTRLLSGNGIIYNSLQLFKSIIIYMQFKSVLTERVIQTGTSC